MPSSGIFIKHWPPKKTKTQFQAGTFLFLRKSRKNPWFYQFKTKTFYSLLLLWRFIAMKYQIPRLLEFFKELNKKCMGKSLKLKTKSSRKKLKTQGQGGTPLSTKKA